MGSDRAAAEAAGRQAPLSAGSRHGTATDCTAPRDRRPANHGASRFKSLDGYLGAILITTREI